MNNKLASLLVVSTTVFVYFSTIIPQTKLFVSKFFLFYFLFTLIAFLYYLWSNWTKNRTKTTHLFIFILSTTALFWVGLTGWYFSPFFYFLYLLGILYAFIFSPIVTLIFVFVLTCLFMPNIGSVDVTFDFVTLVSMFSIIPLSYFLHREYLLLKEFQKNVEVLKEENQQYKDLIKKIHSSQKK